MMAHCFISYRRTPSAAVATALQSKLESQYNIDAYVDTTRTDGTTVRFPERLMQAIADAPVFICLLGERDGQHTLESEWVLKEIQQAYDLQKFCIPVFQESYRPLSDMPPAVDYLLGFDGVHIFDQKNIMVDESVRQLAELIRPHVKKRRVLWVAVFAVMLIAVAGVGAVLTQSTQSSGTNLTLAPTTVTPDAEPTTAVAQINTDIPTLTVTPIDTPTPTETLEINFIVQTLDVQATIEQATLNAQTTAAARATEYAIGTQSIIDQTATATQWTDTPTPDITASIDAYRTQQAQTATEQYFQNLTASATLWTATPTSTWTPSNTPTRTATSTSTPSATFTRTSTPTATLTQLELAVQRASTPTTSNTAWTSFEQDFDGVTMVLVPAGCFDMGSNDGEEDERPVHEVCFNEPFWIDKYEVTNAQFARFNGVAERVGNWTDANRPRERINWFEARDFCELREVRLPTEAEWEYAARGPDNLIYPWGNEFVGDNAVYGNNSNGQTTAVGSRPNGESWVGALDMSGNVWEWVSSLYLDYPHESNHEDAQNSTDVRVLRGGSWYVNGHILRSPDRFRYDPGFRSGNFGVRCARSFNSLS